MAAISPARTHRQQSDVARDADLCRAVLEERLIAYLCGADSVDEYREWLASGDQTDLRIALRLAITRRVILLFDAANCLPMAAPWLREFGAAGDTPARLIRDKGDDDKVSAIITEAVEQWLARRSLGATAPR
jgi:hypothetical protein